MKIILCLFLFIGISCSKQNEDIVWNYLKQEGLTDAGAAGLMGNIFCESGVESVIYEWYYHDSIGLTNDKYNDIFSDNIIKANKLISDILKNKKFNDNTTAYDIINICQGFNNYLFERIKINRPCFMNIGYIFKQPLKDLKYYYKIININYIPFMVSYTNESLFCLFVSFALDN